jgi:thiamine biosynthesis protein ThiS
MNLTINGQKKTISGANNLIQLLQHLELTPECVVVELNGTILTPEEHQVTELQSGDTLELIQFVGGG